MKTYSFAYGSGTVELPLDEKNVIGELHGNAVAPLADIRAALWASLDAPIDSAPLCERARAGDTVALVVSDMTRFWMRQDLVVPHLVDYLTERSCAASSEKAWLWKMVSRPLMPGRMLLRPPPKPAIT